MYLVKAVGRQIQTVFHTCKTTWRRQDLCNKQQQKGLYGQKDNHLFSLKRLIETQQTRKNSQFRNI
ncbi:hypothetical protein EL17_19480 [Anditalea andensis]|uniref:Uncharacterized protein n=1 Tax=Anditalea andensis TaxID=1048983 RepID=A0A074KT78_9BACT|nr:hypothetical protein EL17_19480 [Anditalea andensis]